MGVLFVWFWRGHLDLTESIRMAIAGALVALPLALDQSTSEGRVVARSPSRDAASSSLVGAGGLRRALLRQREVAGRLGRVVCDLSRLPGCVASAGCSPGTHRVRAPPAPVSPRPQASPRPSRQHLAVLRVDRRRPRRRCHPLRPDPLLPHRFLVQRSGSDVRGGTGLACGARPRPTATRLRGNQRCRSAGIGLPPAPTRPGLGVAF